jgi:hypothetical protein
MYKEEVEDKLKHCGDVLDECYSALQSYDLKPDHLLLESVREAIGHIALSTLYFKKTQAELKEPRRQRCSFCKKYENEVEVLIQGPGPLICDGCVRQCHEIILSKSKAKLSDSDKDA